MKQITLLFVGCMAYLIVGCAQATENIGDLASLVCKTSSSSKNHLTSLAGLNGVIDYLSGLASGHKLESCRDKYLESLQQLVHVIGASSTDVCGEEKIALLEDYHRRYISKISKHEKERKHKGKAPKLAKLFFMQYASEVSTLCEEAAVKAVSTSGSQISEDKLERIEKMKKFTDTMGITDFSKGYDGTQMLWNLVDSLSLNKRDKFAKYFTDGSENRFNIQMRNAQSLVELQAYCRHQLRPVYSKSILPVLRLVDMGYYPASDALLKSEGHARDLLYATQVCETILPVGIYPNESLNGKEVVVLTKDEASKMSPYAPVSSSEEAAMEVAAAPSSLNAAELNFADIKCDKVRASVTSRGQIIRRTLKRMVKQMKKLRSVFKGFKLFHRNQGEKLEEIDDDRLEQMAEQSLQVYDKPETGMVRKKRELFFLIAVLAGVVAFFLCWWFFNAKDSNPTATTTMMPPTMMPPTE